MQSNLHEAVKGPAVAVDTVVLGISRGELKVLMLHILGGVYDDKWALPGGLVQIGESPESTAIRVLKNKTNIKSGYLEQLYTFGDPERDSRGQIVSVSYLLLVEDIESYELIASEHYKDIDWKSTENLPDTAFDHKKIIEFAVNRLKSKLGYSNVAHSFLPKEFTLEQLKHVYDVVFQQSQNESTFADKIRSLEIISPSTTEDKYVFKNETTSYFD